MAQEFILCNYKFEMVNYIERLHLQLHFLNEVRFFKSTTETGSLAYSMH